MKCPTGTWTVVRKRERKKADASENPKSKHFVNIKHASPQTRMRCHCWAVDCQPLTDTELLWHQSSEVLKGLAVKQLGTIWCENPWLKAALGLQSGKYDNHGSRRDTGKYRWLNLNTSVSGKITQNMTENIINNQRENKKPFQSP